MPMQAESLQVLESASVAPEQARAIVRAIEIEIAGASNTLATKRDVQNALDVLRAEFRSELVKLAAHLRVEIAKQIGEVRKEIAGVARPMYVAMLGRTAVLLGFVYFSLVELR